MNDIEFYRVFKSKSAIFDEMPSEAMWNKISTSLDARQQKTISKSTILKSGLIIALILGISTLLIMQQPKKQAQKIQPQTTLKDSSAAKKRIQKSQPSTVDFRKKNTPKANTPFRVVRFLPQGKPSANSTNTTKTEDLIVLPNSKEHITEPKQIATPNLEIEEAKTDVFSNRIIISSSQKLSRPQFDSLVQKAARTNVGATGKLLIVKAPGHKIFRKTIIAEGKQDSLFAPIEKLKATKSDSIMFKTRR